MTRFALRAMAGILVVVGIFAGVVRYAAAQTPVEYSAEARFQLDVQVPDAALKAYLPAGWTPNISTRGPAKDANLRVVFIDRMTINGPDGNRPGGRDPTVSSISRRLSRSQAAPTFSSSSAG